jgi:hypothetical protein
MFQKNMKTGFKRRIRMAIQTTEIEDKNEDISEFYSWEWFDGNISYSYSPYTSIELEKKFQIYKNSKSKKNSSFDIKLHICDNQSNNQKLIESIADYSIDFVKMEQTNKKSGFSRKIKREISGTFSRLILVYLEKIL